MNWSPHTPTFHFDGAAIKVFATAEQAPSAPLQWPVEDATWPRMIEPHQVSWTYRGLAVKYGGTCYGFNPAELKWHPIDSEGIGFVTFERTRFVPADGVILGRADLALGWEAWLDTRGFLTLLAPKRGRELQLSILLTSGAASVWDQDWGILALEPRLTPADGRALDQIAREFLARFFALAHQLPLE